MSDKMSVISAAVGGFSGALFAFVFLLISNKIFGYSKRSETQRQVLIRLQINLNEFIENTGKNLQILKNLRSSFSQQESPTVYFDKLWPYELFNLNSVIEQLANKDLMNELIKYKMVLTRINNTIECHENNHSEIRKLALKHAITNEEYYKHMKSLDQNLENLERQLPSVFEETMKNLAFARLLLIQQKEAKAFKMKACRTSKSKLENSITEETKKVRREIEKVNEEGRSAN